jgi:hypothetical protein
VGNKGKEFRIVFKLTEDVPIMLETQLRKLVKDNFKKFKKGVRQCKEIQMYFEEV